MERYVRLKEEVRGSSPLSSTDSFRIEGLELRELPEVLLDTKAKRRLSLRHKTNEELFSLYEAELRVKLTPDQFNQYNRLFGLFHRFLGDFPPTPELAAKFLARYIKRLTRFSIYDKYTLYACYVS